MAARRRLAQGTTAKNGRRTQKNRLTAAIRRRTAARRPEKARRSALERAVPYLALVRSPADPAPGLPALPRKIRVATYNVHRWTGLNGRAAPDAARAGFVISELGVDVMALQEVLRPFDVEDPLPRIADALHLHLAFVATRVHKRGEVGNAILSRWPITSVFALDLSFSRLERRSAVATQFQLEDRSFAVVATHLALVDRTRRVQVRSILEHPQLQGPVILLGDMNAWRRCKATRDLDRELRSHDNLDWPASFPSARPMLALDRVYARGARVLSLEAHTRAAARRASDHLPVIAQISLA
jgi:endonuclease/exonuclease/phosphatase family metal-dependent hydrolase